MVNTSTQHSYDLTPAESEIVSPLSAAFSLAKHTSETLESSINDSLSEIDMLRQRIDFLERKISVQQDALTHVETLANTYADKMEAAVDKAISRLGLAAHRDSLTLRYNDSDEVIALDLESEDE